MASKQVTLNVERRSVLGKQVKQLRRDHQPIEGRRAMRFQCALHFVGIHLNRL